MKPIQYIKGLYKKALGSSSKTMTSISEDPLILRLNIDSYDEDSIFALKMKLAVHPWVSPTHPIEVAMKDEKTVVSFKVISEGVKSEVVAAFEKFA